jgi:hypothetical protein
MSIGTASKTDVIAFLDNRNEKEILVPRSKVTVTTVTPLIFPKENPDNS